MTASSVTHRRCYSELASVLVLHAATEPSAHATRQLSNERNRFELLFTALTAQAKNRTMPDPTPALLERIMLIEKIVKELQAIPEEKLAELYDLIYHFRLGLDKVAQPPRQPGLIAGDIDDAFFEPLPEEELQRWE